MAPNLTQWGLSPEADLVYRVLADRPLSTAGIAIQLGIGIRRARRACEELVASGAVRGELSRTRERVWRAASTNQFLEEVRRRHLSATHTRAVERQRAIVLAGHSRVRELVGESPSPGVRQLTGAAAVRARISQLAAGERLEHLAMSPESVYDAEAIAAAAPLDLDLLSRGVRMRTLTHVSATGELYAEHNDELARRGAEQRVLANVPTKMIIYDRRVVLIPIDPLDSSLGAMEVGVPTIVNALVATFLHAWEGAAAPGVAHSTATSAREDAVIRLLLAGHTDLYVARTLGRSARTVQYTVRSLMDSFGVNTRLALGFALGRSGYRSLSSRTDTVMGKETA
jgi:DNA-binding CsgD family transcriptional regulator